jgi:hypothetical protein
MVNHLTNARGGSMAKEEHNLASLMQALVSGNERAAILSLKALKLSDVIAYRVPSPAEAGMNIL